MKEIEKYTSVIRYGKKGTENILNHGDYITITEKIDGANGSFCYDDVIKEESDMLEGIEESIIRKTIGKNIPPVIREIIKK